MIRQKFVELSQISSTHGYPRIFRTNNKLIKIMWTIFLLFSLTLCCYMISKSFLEYFQFQTTSKIEVKYETNTDLPAVTICLPNFFPSKKAKKFLYTEIEKSVGDMRAFLAGAVNSTYDLRNRIYKLSLQTSTSKYDDEFRRSLGFNKSQMILDCTYNHTECDRNLVVHYFNSDVGNCYRVNVGMDDTGAKAGILTQNKGRLANGVHLIVFAGVFDGQRADPLNMINSPFIYISIENQTQYPMLDEHIEVLKTGSCYDIVLKKTLSKSVPYPYSDCKETTTQFITIFPDANATLASRRSYSQETCFRLCIQRHIISKCNCFTTVYPNIFDAQPCKNDTQWECSMEFIELKLNELCVDKCSPDCVQVSYDYSITSTLYPTRSLDFPYLRRMPIVIEHFADAGITLADDDISFERVKKSVVCIKYYFRDMKYTYIEQSPSRLLVDLLSGIGGALGLCGGVSILTFFEVFEFCIEALTVVAQQYKKNRESVVLSSSPVRNHRRRQSLDETRGSLEIVTSF